MKIFLSHASEDRSHAEEIALALEAGGHDVFFDQHDLSGGQDYHAVIRERIAAVDLFIFLITPHSVEQGGYTLTEVKLARERWPRPEGYVLPVLLEPTKLQMVPAYLRSVTLFEAEGNAAAEIAAHLVKGGGSRKPVVVAAVALAAALAVGFGIVQLRSGEEPSPGPADFVSRIEASQFVSRYVFPPDSLDRTTYDLDPTSRLALEGEDVVRLERVAFGFLEAEDEASAFNLDVRVKNTTAQPIRLDLTPRFFELADDRGLEAELLYFCCQAKGETLEPGSERSIQLIYRSASDWEGKEVTGGMIRFRISGLLPVVQATWSFRPLATAAG